MSASFVAVVVALFAVRPGTPPVVTAPHGGRTHDGVRAGFAYLRGQPVLLLALALSFVLGGLGRNYQVTMAAMSDGPLRAGASGYGVLSTVFALGTVLGALVAARRRSLDYRTLVAAGLLASGLQIVAGLAPGTWSFAAMILPIAAAAVVIDTTVGTRAQLDTDGAMRGRVLAALEVTGSVSAAVGAPLLGWLAEHAGPRQTLVLAGSTAAIATAAAAVALDRQRARAALALVAPRPRHPVRRVAFRAARIVRPAGAVCVIAPAGVGLGTSRLGELATAGPAARR
ncbi:MFS transporter [Micromonospora sp. NPDC005215]|uniref:MFS transporter n=1 Tax=Micromonospora sp. NPDC005215 TaxID=3157024 RepID=UPI00339FEDF7